jgi:tetratricopeptide (TPR) repeat protein
MNHIALQLKDIHFNRRTGRLVLKRGDVEKYFFFQDGRLIQIKTNQPGERLGEVLQRLDKLPRDMTGSFDEYIEPGRAIGEVLVSRGLLSEQDLGDALAHQMQDAVLNAFPYFDAELTFQPRDRFEGVRGESRVNIPSLIEHGIRRMRVTPPLRAFLGRTVFVPKTTASLHLLTDEEKGVLDLVSGRSTAEELLATSGSEPEFFWKSLYLFYCLDLTEALEEGGRHRAPQAEARPAPEPPPAAHPRAPSAGARRDAGRSEAMTQIAEVIEMKQSLPAKDLYQILEVARGAGDDEIKKAYFQLARKFHPDRFTRDVSQGYRDQIDEVFNAITQAYRTLADKTKRQAYDQSTVSSRAEDPVKAAEMKFRQAKTLYGLERFQETIVLLEEAVRLRKKAEYYVLLALAESNIPALLRKAEQDYLQASALEPWNAEPYMGLGLLYQNEGLIIRAKKYFYKAIEMESEHKGALAALKELGEGGKKKGLKDLLSFNFLGAKKKGKK